MTRLIFFIVFLLSSTIDLFGMKTSPRSKKTGDDGRHLVVVKPHVLAHDSSINQSPQQSPQIGSFGTTRNSPESLELESVSHDGSNEAGETEDEKLVPSFDSNNESKAIGEIGEQITGLELQNQKEGNRDAIFSAMTILMNAITNGSLDDIQAFENTPIMSVDGEKLLDFLINNAQNNLKIMSSDQKLAIKAFFNDKTVRRAKHYSFLWSAVDHACHAKINKEDEKTYKKRLEIIHILARVTKYKTEAHPLRSRGNPSLWSLFCIPCCGPCISMSKKVDGGLLHYVAQEGNADILRELLKPDSGFAIEGKDQEGWTAYTNAVWFSKNSAAAVLKEHGAQLIRPPSFCCAD